jgi:hypothetical protein
MLAKSMDEEERTALECRVAAYSNSLSKELICVTKDAR